MLARDMVKAAMLSRGLTQRELADAVKRSPAYLSDVLAGRRQISIDLAKRLAEALGMRPLEILNAQNADLLAGRNVGTADGIGAPAAARPGNVSRETSRADHVPVEYCPQCGVEMASRRAGCHSCGWPTVHPLPQKPEGTPGTADLPPAAPEGGSETVVSVGLTGPFQHIPNAKLVIDAVDDVLRPATPIEREATRLRTIACGKCIAGDVVDGVCNRCGKPDGLQLQRVSPDVPHVDPAQPGAETKCPVCGAYAVRAGECSDCGAEV